MRTFGEVLKAARADRGWSQHYLAERSGIKRGAIAQYETNYHNPSLPVVRQLATTLEVSFSVSGVGWLVFFETRKPWRAP